MNERIGKRRRGLEMGRGEGRRMRRERKGREEIEGIEEYSIRYNMYNNICIA